MTDGIILQNREAGFGRDQARRDLKGVYASELQAKITIRRELLGQFILHCQVHLIPRRKGDVEFPKGGLRNVIANKGNYEDLGSSV